MRAQARCGPVAFRDDVLAFVLVCSYAWTCAAAPPKVVISALIDDFGYASASFNRGANSTPWETRTPNMDAMAADGVILRRFYAHPFCSPTRSSFLSGRLPVHVQTTNTMPDRTTAGIPTQMTTLPEFLVLANASVDSHVVGKYDVGGATTRSTPEGRGFVSSLIYFSHAVDYFSANDFCGPGGDRDTACNCNDEYVDLWDSGAPARALNGTGFVDDLFLARVVNVIAKHDFSSSRSLYIHLCFHSTHDPIQATEAMLTRLANTSDDESECSTSILASATGSVYPGGPTDPVSYKCRRIFEALTQWVDAAFGTIRAALEAADLWDDTLLIASSDNGGQLDLEYGGGSNYPLRGGKGGDFEGGTRVAAFVSGGYLPPAGRGRVEHGLIHVADWLATLCGLFLGEGGAAFCRNDTRARAAGLPQPDSLNVWPLLIGANATSPRVEVPVGPSTLVTERFKLMLGSLGSAGWSGPLSPNASSPQNDPHVQTLNCSAGCLFDLLADEGEHDNIIAQFPADAARLRARLAELRPGFYSNNETNFVCAHNASLAVQKQCACDAAAKVWSGYFGPYAVPR